MKRLKFKIAILTAMAFLTLCLYLLTWPVEIDPISYESPQPRQLAGAAWPNPIEKIKLTDGVGPEDIAIDLDGNVYGGLEDGRIVKVERESGKQTTIADTGYRVGGLAWSSKGSLLVCAFGQGLLEVEMNGRVRTLATAANSTIIQSANDLDVATDGTIYFSDSSVKRPLHLLEEEFLENGPNGRLLRYNPSSRRAEELLTGLHFANGVALSEDESFVLVVETAMYRVVKYILKGPKAGQSETIIDNLPGFPDGISYNQKGTFWLPLINPRYALLDATATSPWLRKVFARIPKWIKLRPSDWTRVLGIDGYGKVTYDFFDPAGSQFQQVSSVEEQDGKLYLGSLTERAIGVTNIKL